MLFSGRLCAGFLPGWLSLVRPREGSQSAGLIIWFEKSGGRGFDKGPLSRAPPPALCVRRCDLIVPWRVSLCGECRRGHPFYLHTPRRTFLERVLSQLFQGSS